MNPRYTFNVSFSLEHGDNAPTQGELWLLEERIKSMTILLFGDSVIQSPNVEIVEDEEVEQDFTIYAEVQATLKLSLTVTSDCEHNASCIAEGLIDDLGDYLDTNSNNSGLELAGTTINKIDVMNIELQP